MKVTDESKLVSQLRDDMINIIDYYTEIDEVSGRQFGIMFREQIDELMKYHQDQIDKLQALKSNVSPFAGFGKSVNAVFNGVESYTPPLFDDSCYLSDV